MKKHTYRVWIEQVNATYLDVKATSKEEAREIGYSKWRVQEAHSRVTAVEKQEAPNALGNPPASTNDDKEAKHGN